MKLALLGRGRMGLVVERLAREAGHEIVLALDVETNRGGAGLDGQALASAEMVIDFTWPEAVVTNVGRVADAGLPMVVGTTGWYDRMEEVRRIVETAGCGLVYGANFSIGANLFRKIVGQAAMLFDRFNEYDPYVLEHHHRGKVDAPSGTALRLAEVILEAMAAKKRIQTAPPEGRIAEEALEVVSLRAGAAFGRHQVGFDGPADTVELVHTARGREGFARGALYAAEWLLGKKGFFEFSECLGL